MRCGVIAAALLLLSVPFMSCCVEESAIADDVRTVVQDLVDGGYAASVVVGVLENGRTEYYGYGAQDGVQAAENTIFEIGSVTKIFTTLLLADMATKGELSLEDPAETFLPARVPSRDGKKITLWHLATHTSGLPRMPDNFAPADWNNPYMDYTAERLYDFLARYELPRDPGALWEYSNLGMGLLGHTLLLKSGMSYEDLVKERICDELGLEDTTITLTQEQRDRLAKACIGGVEIPNWDFDVLAGCGALRSSAKDLLQFLSAEMGLKETRLDPAMELTQEGEFSGIGAEMIDAVGLGWLIPRGKELRWHDGATGGYCSFVGFDRESQRAAVVLLSRASGRAEIGGHVDSIGLHLLDPEFELKAPEKPAMVDTSVYEDYVGEYEIAPGATVTISTEGNRLFAQVTGQDRFEIFPLSESRFFYNLSLHSFRHILD